MSLTDSQLETIFLGGLPDCSREDIVKLCASTGRIASTRVRKGFAFVDYYKLADAAFGIKFLNGMMFKGKKITAEFARRRRTSGSEIEIVQTSVDIRYQSTECTENSLSCFCCVSANRFIRQCPRCAISADSLKARDLSPHNDRDDLKDNYHGAYSSHWHPRSSRGLYKFADNSVSCFDGRNELRRNSGEGTPGPLYTRISPPTDDSTVSDVLDSNPSQRLSERIIRAHIVRHRTWTDDERQSNAAAPNALDVWLYRRHHEEQRRRRFSRSRSPGLQVPRRNVPRMSHNHNYYSEGYFQASVPAYIG
ncbi:hypothetical protein F5050DRAFT_111748 [Lentinula boryana]|uniref:RRM domain-containing protein n=1 Tax=Lentinula boryana TaxID=40481 RepID=A0ABQ8QD98_9AGAR|nr:hypothetical protein F5050DRAFT_111748 [Lentinula boryana]